MNQSLVQVVFVILSYTYYLLVVRFGDIRGEGQHMSNDCQVIKICCNPNVQDLQVDCSYMQRSRLSRYVFILIITRYVLRSIVGSQDPILVRF